MVVTRRAAIALCVTGMVLVGSSVSVSQLLLDYPILAGQAIRYTAAALALYAVARLFPRFAAGSVPRPRPTRRELGILLALAATGMAGFNACILIALHHADAAAVGTVIGAAPLGLALLGPLLRGERPGARLVGAAAVVVAGTALVQGTGRTDAVGLAAAAGALAGEVAFSLLAAAVLGRLGAVRVAAHSCALAVPLLLAGAVATGEIARWRTPTAAEVLALGYLAVFMTVTAFVVWFIGLQRLGVERAGMIVGVMPVATLATAAVMATALPAPAQVTGVLTVAVGLALGMLQPPATARGISPRRTPGGSRRGSPTRPGVTSSELRQRNARNGGSARHRVSGHRLVSRPRWAGMRGR